MSKYTSIDLLVCKGKKIKVIPLQARFGPEGG